MESASAIDRLGSDRGGVSLLKGAFVDVSGNSGGSITIRGGELVLDGALVLANTRGDGAPGAVKAAVENATLANGAGIASDALDVGNGGTIAITATDTVTISGTSADVSIPSGVFANSRGQGERAGDAGNIRINARRLGVSDGALISSTTFGPGKGGTVSIAATDTVTLAGTNPAQSLRSGLFSSALGAGERAGDAGNISVDARTVVIASGAQVFSTTFGPGQGGTVSITAGDRVGLAGTSLDGSIASGVFARAQGQSIEAGGAGDIAIASREVALVGGAEISSTTFGPGHGGTVSVIASETVTASGTSPDRSFVSGIFARAEGGNALAGDGGDIAVHAERVTVSAHAEISSSSTRGGIAGNVRITARDAFLADRGSGSTSADRSRGGNITITAGRDVLLTNEAFVTAESSGAGNAGDILLRADDTIRLSGNSTIDTQATNADGGNITMEAQHLIHLIDSRVASSVGGGTATTGGNIRLDPRFIVLDHSRIVANAFEGNGGNITLVGEVVFADPLSSIDASSALGIDGEVDVQAPIQNLSGTIAPLPQNFEQASTLFTERCAAQKGGKVNSFVIGSRGSAPSGPEGFLSSPLNPMRHRPGASTTSHAEPPSQFSPPRRSDRLERAGTLVKYGCSPSR